MGDKLLELGKQSCS